MDGKFKTHKLWLFCAIMITTVSMDSIAFNYNYNNNNNNRRKVSGVRLSDSGSKSSLFMEIVEEDICSDGIVRLTCRSLKAFVFVLEAEYRGYESLACGYDIKRIQQLRNFRKELQQIGVAGKYRSLCLRHLHDNSVDDSRNDSVPVDLRNFINMRCSGRQHCRFTLSNEHPAAVHWDPANVKLKYACIPENAVRQYCNVEIKLKGGESGYIKSPGYPLYYLGGSSCGWIFKALPGQRISLTFHDFNLRSPEERGNCVDVVRVRERGNTLFESCGTMAGMKVESEFNVITLDLISSSILYPARGFFVHYEVLGCPDVAAPNGSYISNGSVNSRTFLCQAGTLFPDIKQRRRIIECKNGKWNETVGEIPTCEATSAVILKSETENNRLSSLSGDNIGGSGIRIGRGEDAAAADSESIMDLAAQPAMIKQADYVVDVILPTVLIALLFVGNAVIIYIIFQYRKRKVPTVPSAQGEEMALRNQPADVPQV